MPLKTTVHLSNGDRSVMRDGSYRVDSAASVLEADEGYYVKRLKEILEAYPNKGPPHQPSQLCSHIYIGSLRNADDVAELRRLGITHVLNCAVSRRFDSHRSPYGPRSGIKAYLTIPAEDHDQYDIQRHFPEAISFLEKCRMSGGKALIHCNLGVNRSGAVAAAYLMVYQRKPLLQVISFLKEKRSFVLCNKNFRRQLIRFARQRGLLDPVIDASGYNSRSPEVNKKKAREISDASQDYSTGSLDRSFIKRPLNVKSYRRTNSFTHAAEFEEEASRASKSPSVASEAEANLPKPRRSASASNFVTSHNVLNSPSSSSSSSSGYKGDSGKTESFHLDTVPERKPVSEFSSPRAGYQSDGASIKSVSFRRPTANDITEDSGKVRSSPSASPKLGFLSRIGTRITRQRSWGNISRISNEEEEQQTSTSSSQDGKMSDSPKDKASGEADSTLSTSRPLRVYRRAASDTEVYRRPPAVQTYRRAETIATTDYQRERANAELEDDPLLPQEYFYHTRAAMSRYRAATSGSASPSTSRSGGNTLNLLARLKPVSKTKARQNSLQ